MTGWPAMKNLRWPDARLGEPLRQLQQRFDARPRRERLLVVLALAAAGLGLGDALFLTPALTQWKEGRERRDAAAQALDVMRHDMARLVTQQHQQAQAARTELAAARERLRQGEEALRQFEDTLVGPDQMVALLEQLLAARGQLRVRQMRTLPRVDLLADAGRPAGGGPAPAGTAPNAGSPGAAGAGANPAPSPGTNPAPNPAANPTSNPTSNPPGTPPARADGPEAPAGNANLAAAPGAQRVAGGNELPPVLVPTPPATAAAATAAAQAASAANAAAQRPAPSLYRHGVELTLEGSYPELVAWLRALEAQPRRVLWGAMTIKVEAHPTTVMTLRLYTISRDRHWLEI